MDIKDIKVLEGCNKVRVNIFQQDEYKQCLPFALVRSQNTNIASSWTIHQQSRPTLKSLHS